MSEGAEYWDLNIKLSACNHLGTAGLNSFLGGGDPSPTQLSLLKNEIPPTQGGREGVVCATTRTFLP